MANNKSGNWVSSMKTMLGSLTSQRVKACSIFEVPEQLRKSEKEAEVYKPKVVSIGPLHRGTKRDLLYMEEIKYRCMLSLLLRTDDPKKRFTKCSEAILGLDDTVRAFFVDDIKFNSHDLAKIMLLDGCFLLELLIGNAEQSRHDIKSLSGLDLDIKGHSDSDAAARVRITEKVLSDLKLLENQIPLIVLIWLFHLLFTKGLDIDKTYEGVRNTVNGLALFFFGFSPTSTYEKSSAHLLELVHTFETREEKIAPKSEDLPIHIKTSEEGASETELKCCATRLEASGIIITPAKEQKESKKQNNDNENVIFDCYKSLDRETLEIQPLNITEETKILWWNFIAWEQNRTTLEKYLAGKHDQTSRKFSEYALLFKGLVCCEDDIQLLKDRNVLGVTGEKWSNEKWMTFFRTIADGIQIDASVDSKYGQMIKDLNECSGARGNCRIFWHNCSCVLANIRYTLRKWFAILKRDHTPTVWKTIGVLAAVVLLLLTVTQTVFAAIGL